MCVCVGGGGGVDRHCECLSVPLSVCEGDFECVCVLCVPTYSLRVFNIVCLTLLIVNSCTHSAPFTDELITFSAP